jgi:hypothetical protein
MADRDEIYRDELYARWHSLALIVAARANGGTQNLQPDTITGSHAMKSAPSANDWLELQELTGGMLRWLADMRIKGERVTQQMHVAIIEASGYQLGRLLMRIEDTEELVKVKWSDGSHRILHANESDLHGKAQWERRIIMHYRGVHTQKAADELGLSIGKVRWVRRKHGLTILGERMYPCTMAPIDSCVVCKDLNVYSDDYDDQEAA